MNVKIIAGEWPDLCSKIQNISDVAEQDGPSIGVVVPAHNCALWIKSTVESIIRSIKKGDHIYIVENGSSDDTLAILIKLASEWGCISVTSLKIGNAAVARNVGLKMACSHEYIAFCDSDDLWFEKKIATVRAVLRKCNDIKPDLIAHPMIAYGRGRLRLEGGALGNPKRLLAFPYWHFGLYGNPFATSAIILRSEAVPQDLFNNKFKVTQDFEAWCYLAYLRKRIRIIYIDEILGYHRWMGGLSNASELRARNVRVISTCYLSDAPIFLRAFGHMRTIVHTINLLGSSLSFKTIFKILCCSAGSCVKICLNRRNCN